MVSEKTKESDGDEIRLMSKTEGIKYIIHLYKDE